MQNSLIVALVMAVAIQGRSVKEDEVDLELTILHVNDIHAHFEQDNVYSGRCSKELKSSRKCYGGQARMLTKINEIRNEDPEHTLLVNAGDYYTGSAMFSKYGYESVVEFSNLMKYDAVSLGNHDFDLGIEGVQKFIAKAEYPLLAANLDLRNELMMQNFSKSWTKEFEGHKVGIIGYVTKYTPSSTSGDVASILFYNEVETIRNEARWLMEKENCDIIIALGHSGYEVDIEIAKSVPSVDLVIGGHSHTFLWTGDDPPLNQFAAGPYPTYVEQPEGKIVPVVTAYAYSRYLGHFKARFDKNGDLVLPVNGQGIQSANPILLDPNIEENQEVLELIEKYRKGMTEFDEELGSSDVLLKRKWNKESNIGNMIADMVVHAWNCTVDFGIMNNGGIRSVIIPGKVNVEDAWNVLPFRNKIMRATILGKDLKQLLEHKYSYLCPTQDCRASTFFHMSGLKVVVEVEENNQGKRVKELKVRCKSEPVQGRCLEALPDEWCDVEDVAKYAIALQDFLAGRWDFKPLLEDVEEGEEDIDMLKSYIQNYSPLKNKVEGRITIDYVLPN